MLSPATVEASLKIEDELALATEFGPGLVHPSILREATVLVMRIQKEKLRRWILIVKDSLS